ncbi:BON domain-containing protein [Calidifontimicrobium sp. SYSU G02091]|uniref:BON domain-containing protein n=1 Tax=Calidifontimicrobium sp. SYSU G02091 TaxID=2926421 RepID=UPI001F52FA90|nr:BON domain-containing protein [Calidifontimicrobium sp. SYSU G02091]MCI1191685.1 BON domain-containing protein [Calidifontimicrobium sp. SYSU G02091]
MTTSSRPTVRRPRAAWLLVAAIAGSTLLAGCAPLVLGGAAVGTVLVANDRRTAGIQLEDQAIELKGRNRARDVVGDRGHVNVTSYNRIVLLTGEVPTDADRARVEEAVKGVDNVRSVVNELAVMPASSLTERANDGLLTSRVKASFIDVKDLDATAVKVVTERGVVHLMGRVTEAEAQRATELARGVRGVQKVVRVFELITPEELAAMRRSGG